MSLNRSLSFYFIITILAISVGIILPFIDISGIFAVSTQYPIFDIIKEIVIIAVIYIFINTLKIDKRIKNVILLGFAIRLCALIAIGIFGILPYSYDIIWDTLSNQMLFEWRNGNFYTGFDSSDNVRYYTLFSTFTYYLLGFNPFFMCLINVFFGTLSILYVYKISLQLFNDNRIARVSAVFLAFWPTHIMFSAMNMRDSLSTLLILLFVNVAIKLFNSFKIPSLTLLIILYILNFLIRSQNAVLILICVTPFIIYFVFKKSNIKLIPVLSILLSGTILAVFVIIYSKGYFNFLSLDYFNREMQHRSDGGAAYLANMTYGSWIDVIIYAPLRLIYFLYSPFFWDVSGIGQLLAMAEGVVLIYMTFFIVIYRKNISYKINNKAIFVFFVLFCLIGLVANATIDSNSGTAMRHKLQYLYLFFILFTAARYKKES